MKKYTDLQFMQIAYEEAACSADRGEVPVGAVLADKDGFLIARGGNRSIADSDPSGHAEINVLRKAGITLNNYRLADCTIYVTLEPCIMCADAMIHARIKRIVYGAADPKAGALGSKYLIGSDGKLNHKLDIISGLMAAECGQLLRDFFKSRRR